MQQHEGDIYITQCNQKVNIDLLAIVWLMLLLLQAKGHTKPITIAFILSIILLVVFQT